MSDAQIIFTWSTEPDWRARSGERHVLRSPTFPKGALSQVCADDRVGVCSFETSYRKGVRGKWRAVFWLGYETIYFIAGTPAAAMRALERELDKRSIGLFGVDVIAFTHS